MLAWLRRIALMRLQRQYLAKLDEARSARDQGDTILAAMLFQEAQELEIALEERRQGPVLTA